MAAAVSGRLLSEEVVAAAPAASSETRITNAEVIEFYTRMSDTVLLAMFVLPILSLIHYGIMKTINEYYGSSSSDSSSSSDDGDAKAEPAKKADNDVEGWYKENQSWIDEELAVKDVTA